MGNVEVAVLVLYGQISSVCSSCGGKLLGIASLPVIYLHHQNFKKI